LYRILAILLLSPFVVVSVSRETADSETVESLVRVRVAERQELHRFTDMGMTITDREGDYAKLIATQDQVQQLRQLGYDPEILIPDMVRALDWLKEMPDRGQYHSYAELLTDLTTLVNTHPTITELDTIGYSVQGRLLLALKITDNPEQRENEPEVRIIGCHHGNEAISVEVPLSLGHYLAEQYGTDPEVTHLVDTREIWIIPMMNPDGLQAGTRRNANNVDLNRDYGYMWEGEGGSPASYSQPETKAIYLFSQEHNFSLSLSHHSGAEYVNYLWNYTPIRTQDDSLIVNLSYGYNSYSGYPVTNGWDWYETHGDCNDYSYGIDGDIDWTIELSYSFVPPTSAIDSLCERNREAQMYIIKKAGQGIAGYVLDAVTGDTITQAMVDVEELNWPVYVDPYHGDYHSVLLPGMYTITASANGYLPQTISNVQVFEDSTTDANFSLQPGGGFYAYKFVLANVSDPLNSYNNHTLTPDALGPVDGEFLSIGVDGEVILDMGSTTPIVDAPGVDFTVYEGDDGTPLEGYRVYLSNNWNGPWTLLGSATGTASFDIGEQGFTDARFVRILDDGGGSSTNPYAGFDLDAIEAGPVSGPLLLMQSYEIDDGSGNGNGRVDPGESPYLLVTLSNLGADTAYEVAGILRGGDSWVSVVDSIGDFGDIPPLGELTNTSDPFVVAADSSTPGHHSVQLSLFVSAQEYEDTFMIQFTVGTGGDYLVWDPDPNHSSGPLIKQTLDSLRYDGVYTTSLLDYLEELADFKAVFVCAGIYNTTAVISDGSAEAESLASYLVNRGGNLYLEGGDIWYWDPRHRGGYDFGPLFGINALSDGSSDLSTLLGEDETFTEGMSFSYSGENSYIDRLSPNGTGFTLFTNSSPSYVCGVGNAPGGYRTIGVAFEFSGCTDGTPPASKLALADSIMRFFGIRTNVPPAPFSLIYPDGDTLAFPILFDWQDSQDPDPQDSVYYTLYLSETPDFSSPTMYDSLRMSECTVDTLPVGKVLYSWYWRVRAFDTHGGEVWSSETFTFSIEVYGCGDVNGDGVVTVADATYVVSHIYRNGPPPLGSGDVNLDGRVTVADATYLITYIYRGGTPPCEPPFTEPKHHIKNNR